MPTKPETREFCAKCHGAGSTLKEGKEAPKIDVSEHGESAYNE